MQGFGQSASRNRFQAEHRVFAGGLNPSLEEPRAVQLRQTTILNGDKIYSHEGVIARAKKLGSVVVQFVSKSGRRDYPRTCDTLVEVANAIPQEFNGGYVTIRANRLNEYIPPAPRKSRRLPSWVLRTDSDDAW